MTKRKKITDPHAKREAERYDKPIPSREYILDWLASIGKPQTQTKIAQALNLTSVDAKEALRRRLRAMLRDGQLIRNRRGSYCLANKMDLLRGRVIAHRDGYGFVVTDKGDDDLYLSAREMRQVFNGDIVLVRVVGIDARNRLEGSIVEVLERNTNEIVGRFFIENGVGFVEPENKSIVKEIMIPAEHFNAARNNEIVVAEIIAQPSMRSRPTGRIVQVLGEHMAPGMEIEIALRAFDLPHVWNKKIITESKKIPKKVKASEVDDRIDLRELPLVTIDGEDAKDFDDAVYCEPKPKGGWRLFVAIADVSHYVEPETALDSEAELRGNSVYFPGSVIPMLPESLSNEICSLKPKVDRLCMVCEMSISAKGKITRSRFYPGVMHSHARLTYTEVAKILDGNNKLTKKYEDLVPELENLYDLYQTLVQQRQARGAIEFDTQESYFTFDDQRKIKDIKPTERNDAHRLIEECMLCANICAAKFIKQHKIPAPFRVHEPPNEEKILKLRQLIKELGLKLGGGENPSPEDFAALMSQVQKRPDMALLQTAILRTMSMATYTTANLGHFGLAYKSYAHFTSPIRRYPDLLLHRAIKHILTDHDADSFYYDIETMEALCEHASTTERRAEEATRDVISWLKCEFMLNKIGQHYTGIISGVTGFGLFVTLDEVFVDGLVHVTSLPNDYYHFDPVRHTLRGERAGQRFRLGDKVQVKVMKVNLDSRQVDFELINKKNKKFNKKGKTKK